MARMAMIGATGLVGRSVAPALIEAGHDLLIVGRRGAGVDGAREVVAPIAGWSESLAGTPLDVAISAVGTTWRKAGNWEAFEAVDRFAVAAFAQAARAAGARQFILVSSVGADPAAANRYLALKGAVEADLAALGFEQLDIVRPGLLTGKRGRDRRPGERFGILVSPLVNPFLRGRLARFRAIPAATVARAIVALAGNPRNGRRVHTNRDLERLAQSC